MFTSSTWICIDLHRSSLEANGTELYTLGNHKGCPYGTSEPPGPSGLRTCGSGNHEGCPYGTPGPPGLRTCALAQFSISATVCSTDSRAA